MAKVGIDLDGVLYDWVSTALFLLNHYKGYTLGTHKDHTDWNYIQDRVTPEDWKWLWHEGQLLGLFRHGNCYKGGFAALIELYMAGHYLHIITARPEAAHQVTKDWLEFHQVMYHELSFVDSLKEKAKFDLDWMIDDSPDVIEAFKGTKTKVIKMVRPWNSSYTTLPYISVHSWNIIPDIIDGRVV